MKRRLLWVGDAVVSSGFARATHKILDTVRATWDVTVIGINYGGDPHEYPYPIYPAMATMKDPWGLDRVKELSVRVRPDLIVIQNDPWNVPTYMQCAPEFPMLAVMPVDGLNCRGTALNGLTHALFWTEFGLKEARQGGYTGPASVVPLGVDLDVYHPMPKARAMELLALPSWIGEAFVVGNVNRNQPRKRLDLTVSYFCEWVKAYDVPNAYLYLHVAPTGDRDGIDVVQLMRYYGLKKRLILATPEMGYGASEALLCATYNCFDVQVNTGQGEGFGLTTLEGMACGVPQVVGDWAALGEWPGDGVEKVPCTSISVTQNQINVIGGIPDRSLFIRVLDGLYADAAVRAGARARGLNVAADPRYRWDAIGRAFMEALEASVTHPYVMAAPMLSEAVS